ncbi:fimbria/pilus outer membrane usher protein [Burkholderia territorii]|uniref:Fimbrial biogenesis outer membrane usher protein n=1 Tax=Burkholderia territorii TaxID=1503055 RepID=A0A6L3NNE9_9BURK|nr:fimbria/pilus outer membrane usher protein [Burkholderia territorii]KAB0686468.1 fimbrial biogenesis outer membrane usher protein [Burkholderia territorii]MBM2775676.1 fimbrial biogenesis outer membrane usher protein [Burkholderia territorii]VWB70135.1 fimbrial protein [Burkholderia territorii]
MSDRPNSTSLRSLTGLPHSAMLPCTTPLYLAICVAFANKAHAETMDPVAGHAAPTALTFNKNFLHDRGRPTDLSSVLAGDSTVPPGTYRVEVQVNGDLVTRRDIEFRFDATTGRVAPCLSALMLQEFGVNLHALTPAPDVADAACIDVANAMDQAAVNFDAGRLRLDLSIPQAFLSRTARGYVDPALWDAGVAAGYVNYQFTGNYNRSAFSGDSRSYFLGLQNGVNIGPWRLRNESTLSGGTGGKPQFKSNRTLVERDITSLKSQLALGEQYTDSTLFDSVRFRGLKIGSDDAMLPDSERGYAPVIRGQAFSNAVVEVRQSNYVLYRANVPPGPFELTDIFPSGSNGDLEITVTEADGSKHVTRQAFSSLPLMLRKGRMKYAFSAGQYQGSEGSSPTLATGSLVYGLTDNSTVAGGFQVSKDFQAFNLGVGTNTPIGALSLDVTQSFSRARGARDAGQSVRVLYAKTFTRTNTNFTLAAYRYSTEGYRTFSDHVNDRNATVGIRAARNRSRIDLTTSQDLGQDRKYGSVYLNVGQQTYWNQAGSSRSISMGYGNNWKQLSYNLSFTQSRDTRYGGSNTDTQVMASLSIPLGKQVRSPRVYANINRDNTGGAIAQSGLSGSFNERTSYAAQAGYTNQGQGVAAGASLTHNTDIGRLSASYNYARSYRSASVGTTGALVIHGGGVNLSRTLGDTFALMKVEGVKSADVRTEDGVRIGRNGYMVVPYAQPYRVNTLRPDTRNLGADVELIDTAKQVVPRRGAVVEAVFKANGGRRVQFNVAQADGQPVPFGASLEDLESGKQLGIVDPGGNALVLLEQEQGTLKVKWTEGECRAPYALPKVEAGRNYQRLVVRCR